MAQYIDIEFRERATSTPLNKRFRDITGPTVLSGFRLALGSENFSISLTKGSYVSNVAVTPSGARVEEDMDVLDAVMISPNDLNAGNPRVDTIYMVYQFGGSGIPATYVVVPGTGGSTLPAPNPNPNTYLLIGYVNVPPQGAAPQLTDLTSVPVGLNTLEVVNSATFHGPSTFKNAVVFEQPVQFLSGTTGTQDPSASFQEQLSYPIIAAPGQQSFTVPVPYTPNTNSIHVYKDWVVQPPSEYLEDSQTTFKFFDPCKGGEKIWFTWASNISLYTPASHNHDDLYYRKNEVNNMLLHNTTDYFAGTSGRVIYHYLGTTDYVVIPPVPTDHATDVGEITLDKNADSIVVYNTGTYRGKFDISYYLKNSYQYVPNNEDVGMFNITATSLDTNTYTWQTVNYKRNDGTLYLQTQVANYDARGYYRRLVMNFYNTAGTDIIETITYALDYDTNGLLYQRTLIPS